MEIITKFLGNKAMEINGEKIKEIYCEKKSMEIHGEMKKQWK